MQITCQPPGVSGFCVPGCWSSSRSSRWCLPEADGETYRCGGPFKPENLDAMMTQHEWDALSATGKYNEVIVDGNWYTDNLPLSIEAFVGTPEAHSAFLQEYGLRPVDVPLFEYRAWDELGFASVSPKASEWRA